MNDDEKNDRLGRPEGVADDGAAQVSGDSFSVGETETNEQEELAQQIEVEPDAPHAIRKTAHLTLVSDNNDDPPDWPNF